MKQIMKTIVAAALVAGMGSAFANEPVALTETQMENVTAGGNAAAIALAGANGLFFAATQTTTATGVAVTATFTPTVGPLSGFTVTKDLSVSLSSSSAIAQ